MMPPPEIIGKLASFSMRNLRRTYQNGARHMPPSDEEINAVTVSMLSSSASSPLIANSFSEFPKDDSSILDNGCPGD